MDDGSGAAKARANGTHHLDYIELFSGIGAFTQAIRRIDPGARCLLAADSDPLCSEVYRDNYGIDSLRDIRGIDVSDVPDHDLCFFSPPCQAFSKSGNRQGFEDARGTLVYEVFRILDAKHPGYILMENVQNLVTHDHGRTMRVILDSLHSLGYRTTSLPIILSPHQLGIPQTRPRAFLPGIYDPSMADVPLDIRFDAGKGKEECSVESIIDHSFDNDPALAISDRERFILDAWDAFIQGLDRKPTFPFFSKHLDGPDDASDITDWRHDHIRKSRAMYRRNRGFIDAWMEDWDVGSWTDTQRILEWQAGDSIGSVWEGVIQQRPSGWRVKAPTTLPALVAIVQTPIIAPLGRRLSVRECANLQSFPQDFSLDVAPKAAYRMLGNSINVDVLEAVTRRLLDYRDVQTRLPMTGAMAAESRRQGCERGCTACDDRGCGSRSRGPVTPALGCGNL